MQQVHVMHHAAVFTNSAVFGEHVVNRGILHDLDDRGGVSGAELAQQLRRKKSDLRVIYSSGYSSEIIGKNVNENISAFLPKPYRPPQLALHVRKSLDGPPLPILEVATV